MLFLDTETRSRLSLKTAGAARYSTDVQVIIVSWAKGYGPASVWDVLSGRPLPPALDEAIQAELDDPNGEVWAHQSYFDRTQTNAHNVLKRRIPLEKWRCTMTLALAHGLPGGLDKLCEIFKIDDDKSKLDGKELINLFCKPRKDGSFNDRTTHPEEWKKFLEYAKRDIPAMQEVHRKCPKWNYGGKGAVAQRETRLWFLDQRINDRGFAVDTDFARHAVRATEAEKKRLAARTHRITEGVVERATQRDMLLGYLLLEYGVSLPDLKADTIERRLEDPELPEFVKELLRIRLQATKASTSKYKRVLQMEVGGRMYGTLQFCAANRTGRWGGRGFQPQNLLRPTHKFPEIEMAIEAFKAECEDIAFTTPEGLDKDGKPYDPNNYTIMAYASSAIRSVIVAGPGKKLVVSDLSNIEGRMLAWLAGEEWKLEAFRAFDRGEGPDLYKVAYARSFNIDPSEVEDDSDERQIGKVQELALGYQGGVNAYVTMSATYGVDLEAMAAKAWDTIPRTALRDAQGVYAWAVQQKRTYGLSDKVYIVCEALKALWRQAHPETVTLWEQTELAAKNAILNPKVKFEAGKLSFIRDGNWLYMRLPSGRLLCYPHPKVEGNKISYMGFNVYSKRWHRIYTYGGKLVENGDQASSRDVLADAMPRADDAGYTLVLDIHDELMAEVPLDRDDLNDEGLSAILSTNSDWNLGLPLAAKGMTTTRYRKG